jgi:2,3-dihydroxybenzoate decarboxylase
VRANVTISTSGMPWEPAIMFCRSAIGADRVMYSMDYPYEYELAEVEMTDNLPLSAEEMAQFYEHIARRVFSLPA